jgi:hypothetical protein
MSKIPVDHSSLEVAEAVRIVKLVAMIQLAEMLSLLAKIIIVRMDAIAFISLVMEKSKTNISHHLRENPVIIPVTLILTRLLITLLSHM